MKYKTSIKPVYNFQSVEVSFETDNLQEVVDFVNSEYEELLEILKEITDETLGNSNQPQRATATRPTYRTQSSTEYATARQIEIMNKFNIPYDEFTTREEAQALIRESIQRTKN